MYGTTPSRSAPAWRACAQLRHGVACSANAQPSVAYVATACIYRTSSKCAFVRPPLDLISHAPSTTLQTVISPRATDGRWMYTSTDWCRPTKLNMRLTCLLAAATLRDHVLLHVYAWQMMRECDTAECKVLVSQPEHRITHEKEQCSFSTPSLPAKRLYFMCCRL